MDAELKGFFCSIQSTSPKEKAVLQNWEFISFNIHFHGAISFAVEAALNFKGWSLEF